MIRKSLEHNVTGIMTKSVVDRFEAVDVTKNDPEWEAMTRRAAQLTASPFFDGAAIGQSRKRIGTSGFLELESLDGEFAVQINDAATDTDASQHFAWIEGLGEVVVGAGFQGFDYVPFLSVAGHDD